MGGKRQARASRASALLQGMRRLARRLKCDSCLRRNAGQTRSRFPDYGARFNASTAFNPPNANELLSTARTGISRATFGT